MSKKYLFIDTNIYVFCATLSEREHDNELINKFISILKANDNIILLVPEIVQLEYKRVSMDDLRTRKKIITDLCENIIKGHKGLSIIIPALLKKIIKGLEDNHKKVSDALEEIFKLKTARLIKITPQIFIDAYRRAIVGKKPFSIKHKEDGDLHNPINADCVTIESIRDFFSTQKTQKDDKLFICTKDISDFSDGKGNPSPDLASDLSIEVFFYDNFPKLITDELKGSIKKETITKYEHLTASLSAVNSINLTQDFCTVAVTPNQLGALNSLGVNLVSLNSLGVTSKNYLSASACISPTSVLLGQDQNIVTLSELGQSNDVLGSLLDPNYKSATLINPQQKCNICGMTFKRSITDILTPNECPSCRNNSTKITSI